MSGVFPLSIRFFFSSLSLLAVVTEGRLISCQLHHFMFPHPGSLMRQTIPAAGNGNTRCELTCCKGSLSALHFPCLEETEKFANQIMLQSMSRKPTHPQRAKWFLFSCHGKSIRNACQPFFKVYRMPFVINWMSSPWPYKWRKYPGSCAARAPFTLFCSAWMDSFAAGVLAASVGGHSGDWVHDTGLSSQRSLSGNHGDGFIQRLDLVL